MIGAMASPPPLITSLANPRVRAAVGLRDRRGREAAGMTIVDGAREVRRALEAGVVVADAFVSESLLAGQDARVALDLLEGAGVSRLAVSETVFAKLAFGSRSEGLIVVIATPSTALADLRVGPEPLLLVIEGVEKPGNLGAVLRTADGAGVDAVIAASLQTDPFNPNAIRASAGTIFGLPLASAGTDEVIEWLHSRGIRIVTARVDAEATYTESVLTGPLAIVLGAEAGGLTSAWEGPDISSVRIPMAGTADSLNVSISAAILAYEARRQRAIQPGGHR
jgi:RNA methyltransferase, TrmH family